MEFLPKAAQAVTQGPPQARRLVLLVVLLQVASEPQPSAVAQAVVQATLAGQAVVVVELVASLTLVVLQLRSATPVAAVAVV
jgi:hypothetical protein